MATKTTTRYSLRYPVYRRAVMELGMIGLGRMGANMTLRLLNARHRVLVYDSSREARDNVVKQGAIGAGSIEELIEALARPRIVWLMLPAGEPTESTVSELATKLSPDDFVVDGGNSNYKDSIRRAAEMSEKGMFFLDVGTSGGVWGLKEGYCLMVGGDASGFRYLEPVFQALAPSPDRGYGHVGPSGAGHFVKMVHNAIEYGLMEAYAEGFELMESKREFALKLPEIAEIWMHGSVVRSWLLELTTAALKQDPKLDKIQAYVADSGEGRWAVEEAVELAVPMPAIALALQMRFRSRQTQPFGSKLLAALRTQFGGHPVKEAKR
ncbi:MAG: decarboxylating 6-phosphogluconate dehydrogenase [Chloroflexi bacterium]|nr:decarboxylating 6-phosphogluconate dehydrogenase [Chloroflexota bacterium]